MPINKNAYLRLKTIDTLLASGIGYTKAEILVKIQDETGFEVSPFTFDKDLQLLRDNLHAPIEYTQRDGYYYSTKNFRLFSSVLNDEDVEALEFASDALNTLNVELAQEAQAVLMSIYARAKKQDSKPCSSTSSSSRITARPPARRWSILTRSSSRPRSSRSW